MKILLINKYHYIKGGADTVFFNQTKLLEDNGFEVVHLCADDPKAIESTTKTYLVESPEIRNENGIGKFKAIGRFFWNRKASQMLEDIIIREKPDVAHLHNIMNALSFSILPVLKKYNIPVVITMHDTRFICPSSYFRTRGKLCDKCLEYPGWNCIRYKCYQDSIVNSIMVGLEMFQKERCFHYDKYFDKYIFVSHQFQKYHIDRHSWFKKKGIVLYNFLPNLKNVIPNNVKGNYLLYYGRITVEKGIKTLVNVMKTIPHIQLKIAGTGPLLEELKLLNIPNIEFLGFLTGKTLFDYVANASFILCPSECEENNPLTVIEAYSYGKPAIGSRKGGIPEIIIDGETGYTFDACDEKQLIDAISKAWNLSDERYKEMSINARVFAEDNFSPEHQIDVLAKVYNEVIKEHKL